MHHDRVDWAGVPFLPVFHHDGRFFRGPGLYGFVRRVGDERTLLFVDHAESIAAATTNHLLWVDALRLGFNELNVCTRAVERVDRLVLRAHIVKRCSPLLNLLQDESGEKAALPPPPSVLRRAQSRS
jgi:hypothetical protein